MADMEQDVRASVGSIYAQLINKRKIENEKRLQEESKDEEKNNEEVVKMTKKERRQADLDAWKEIVIGLTGDDLEFSRPKSKKKKYKQWIDSDDNTVVDVKPKKIKKKNYNKEFASELTMLKSIVADQNKFTADLQKRFMNAAGPATKDAQMPNKTLVELASAINAGRTNSLGMLREISNVKKTIADLYMKQKKLDYDTAGSTVGDSGDIGLMGSNIAASLFGSSTPMYTNEPSTTSNTTVTNNPVVSSNVGSETSSVPVVKAEAFDPDSWEGPVGENDYTRFENIPSEVIVQKDRNTGDMRFAAINTETGEELEGYDIPQLDPTKLAYNEKDGFIRGPFDETYRVQLVG